MNQHNNDADIFSDNNPDKLIGNDDVFLVYDGFGDLNIEGGEDGEIWGDTVYAGAMTDDVRVVFSDDETGTISDGSGNVNFAEIETVILGSGNDQVELDTQITSTVNGGDGYDTLVLPDPEPGESPPVVTITSSSDNGDGTMAHTGYVTFGDGTRMTFKNFEEIICFVDGTLIDTKRGKVAVEDLVAGDHVLTRDNGYQPLVWVGKRDLSIAEMLAYPKVAPILIPAGSLGYGTPERDLRVSPRHRMLINSSAAEMMFGEREVLIAAEDLVGSFPGVVQESASDARYIHIMCDKHEIVRAEGAWSESFQPSDTVVNTLDEKTKEELLTLFPELYNMNYNAARTVLSSSETKVLLDA